MLRPENLETRMTENQPDSRKNQDSMYSRAIANQLQVSSAPNALAERIKELNCLYGISNLLEIQDVSLPWILMRAVELIPTALQYPEKACACIRLDNQDYRSANFRRTRWNRNTKIMLNGQHVGDLDVFYTEAISTDEDGLFLEEESLLLRAISERLSRVLWMKLSEEALKESEERYRVLMEQVTDGVALVQNSRFCYVNQAFCNMFNIPSAETMINESVHSPATGYADDIMRLYMGCTDRGIDDKIEHVHSLARPEKTLWIQVCHTPITFKGRPAVLSTFNDVTEIKEQQVAAQHLAAQLHDENRLLRSSLKERYRLGNILGRSPLMQEVFELILKAAGSNASVAIFGESGSGKELVAQAIHEHSPRKNGNFVAVNCGAIQESLFEREFFGHRKGAFSSAHADSAGYLDMADQGTLFLDEVSELTVGMQAKLLRAIEGGGYRPLGGTEPILTDFRIISASNVSLSEKVSSGKMRNDFFYRLQVIQIQLPPLRDRKQDIPLLVDHFVQIISPSTTKIPGHIMDSLTDYDWPGNVRELRNVLQRYLTLGQLEFFSPNPAGNRIPAASQLDLGHALRQLENSLIEQALRQTDGNRTRAAALLGISRRALFRKIACLDVPESPDMGDSARTTNTL
jgi:two-component system, NtrC family, response regulator HydG